MAAARSSSGPSLSTLPAIMTEAWKRDMDALSRAFMQELPTELLVVAPPDSDASRPWLDQLVGSAEALFHHSWGRVYHHTDPSAITNPGAHVARVGVPLLEALQLEHSRLDWVLRLSTIASKMAALLGPISQLEVNFVSAKGVPGARVRDAWLDEAGLVGAPTDADSARGWGLAALQCCRFYSARLKCADMTQQWLLMTPMFPEIAGPFVDMPVDVFAKLRVTPVAQAVRLHEGNLRQRVECLSTSYVSAPACSGGQFSIRQLLRFIRLLFLVRRRVWQQHVADGRSGSTRWRSLLETRAFVESGPSDSNGDVTAAPGANVVAAPVAAAPVAAAPVDASPDAASAANASADKTVPVPALLFEVVAGFWRDIALLELKMLTSLCVDFKIQAKVRITSGIHEPMAGDEGGEVVDWARSGHVDKDNSVGARMLAGMYTFMCFARFESFDFESFESFERCQSSASFARNWLAGF